MFFTYYDGKTGKWCGHVIDASEAVAYDSAPAGSIMVRAPEDPASLRWNGTELEAATNSNATEFEVKAEEHERKLMAQAQINELELQSLRPLRELWLDMFNTDSKTKLETIEAEVVKMRKILNRSGEPNANSADDRDADPPDRLRG